MRNLLFICLLATNVICYSQNANNSAKAVKKDTSKTKHWIYKTEQDKMSSSKIYYATLDANEKLYLPSPYDGGSFPILTIIWRDSVNSLAFWVDKGKLVENTDSMNTYLKLRFDNEKSFTHVFFIPDDKRENLVSVDSGMANELIAKLKTAKRLRIEAEFYQKGYEVVEFNVQGLSWSHKGLNDRRKVRNSKE